jgi:blue copper oxidase
MFMKRRDFIKMLGLTALSTGIPFPALMAIAAETTRVLPIAPLLRPEDGRLLLTVQEGQTTWFGRKVKTWGYSADILGPTLALRKGELVTMNVQNRLPESTALHWHGLEVPGIADGGPQAMIPAGGSWKPTIRVDQPASTCWYHPHPHQRTGFQVAMGLAGMIIVEDETSDALALPKTYGVDDIPVVIQDKRLDENFQISYAMDVMTATVGWFGDLMITNGAFYPHHEAPQGWVRLRLLNGCNARSLRLACSDNRPMYVIASDGGFLETPIQVHQLDMLMGERFEVLIDLGSGRDVDLLSLPVRQPGMNIPPFDQSVPVLRLQPNSKPGHRSMPKALVKLPAIPSHQHLPIRYIDLSMDHWMMMQGMRELRDRFGGSMGPMMGGGMMGGGMMGGGMMGRGRGMMGRGMMGGSGGDIWKSNMINGRAFTMNYASFDVKVGQYEKWIINGSDMMLHPFHVHGCQFRILQENNRPPLPHRRGVKDTVLVQGGESVILVRFKHQAPPERMYMAHCHLLEHEDTGMMMSFTTSAAKTRR